ncbi:MAG: hypothetical protein QM790_19930 [Nibricoccus sp.]
MPSRHHPRFFAVFSGLAGAIVLALAGCSTAASRSTADAAALFPEIGYEDAVDLAVHQDKPLLILFDSNRPSERQKLVTRTLNKPELAALLRERAVCFHVDVTDLPDIAKLYRVTTTPAIVLLDPHGKEIRRWRGAPKAERVTAELVTLLTERTAWHSDIPSGGTAE